MISDVYDRLRAIPFIPFLIRTLDGREYAVPTCDHAFVTPRRNRVVVVNDEGTPAVLGPLHINAIIDSKATAE